jgi:uncharacterized protein (TIGR00369 family)
MHHKHLTLNDFAHIFSSIPFNRTIGLELLSIQPDDVTLRFDMKKELIGNFLQGILHGGVISSVLDMAGGAAAMIAVIKKYPDLPMEELKNQLGKSTTVNLNINFIRPGKGEHFIAKALVSHSGNKITYTRMELFNHEEVLIATGTGTYLIG